MFTMQEEENMPCRPHVLPLLYCGMDGKFSTTLEGEDFVLVNDSNENILFFLLQKNLGTLV